MWSYGSFKLSFSSHRYLMTNYNPPFPEYICPTSLLKFLFRVPIQKNYCLVTYSYFEFTYFFVAVEGTKIVIVI